MQKTQYLLFSLDRKELDPNPFIQFKNWFNKAKYMGVRSPEAITLATTNVPNQIPDARIVLLKEVTEDGFIFFTNYKSKKAIQLLHNNFVSCVFWWPEIEQQIRFKGTVELINKEKSRQYFNTRPRGSRISSWSSIQNKKIAKRYFLEKNFLNYVCNFLGKSIMCPFFWGGILIRPFEFEFWQGRNNRLHDRFIYRQNRSGWNIYRIAP